MTDPNDNIVVVGWKLDPLERTALLQRFPPRWPDPVADHVTLRSGPLAEAGLPVEAEGAIVGEVDDDEGVQAMVMRIGGTTNRPGGGTYHITWSLDRARGRCAEESNDVIAARGWRTLDEPVQVRLRPARF